MDSVTRLEFPLQKAFFVAQNRCGVEIAAAFKFLWNMDKDTRQKIDDFKKAQKEQ